MYEKIVYFEIRQDNHLISWNYHEPTESLGYFHLELFYQLAAEMLKSQEQLCTNIEEVGGRFDGCRADIMDKVMFIIKHTHCEYCSCFITPNRWRYIFGRRLAIAMALPIVGC